MEARKQEDHIYENFCRFGRGGGRGGYDEGPPAEVVEAGLFTHTCEGEIVCKLINEKVGAPLKYWAKSLTSCVSPREISIRKKRGNHGMRLFFSCTSFNNLIYVPASNKLDCLRLISHVMGTVILNLM